MKKPPRPWKKHARIERVELNNGDVKFRTIAAKRTPEDIREFETLDGALADLDAWWDAWWPVQVRSVRTS